MIADLSELAVDYAIAEAQAGRFDLLADTLQENGTHPKIVAWVRAGCSTTRPRGHPPRSPSLEHRIAESYAYQREMIPPEDLSEKALELTIEEHFNVDRREVRKIIAKRKAESIARAAKNLNISEAEAKSRWDEDREHRWTKWRELRNDPNADDDLLRGV